MDWLGRIFCAFFSFLLLECRDTSSCCLVLKVSSLPLISYSLVLACIGCTSLLMKSSSTTLRLFLLLYLLGVSPIRDSTDDLLLAFCSLSFLYCSSISSSLSSSLLLANFLLKLSRFSILKRLSFFFSKQKGAGISPSES